MFTESKCNLYILERKTNAISKWLYYSEGLGWNVPPASLFKMVSIKWGQGF